MMNKPVRKSHPLLDLLLGTIMKDCLIPVYPPRHQLHKTIYWDTSCSQYYNRQSDIYLSDDDVEYHKLPKTYGPLPPITLGPSNTLTVIGGNDTEITFEHTEDTFTVCWGDFVIFDLHKYGQEWFRIYPFPDLPDNLLSNVEIDAESKATDNLINKLNQTELTNGQKNHTN